jgi:hypothetical protein
VTHGGIMPSNVLVFGHAATPSIKVTDFGLRLADERADDLALAALAGTLLGPAGGTRTGGKRRSGGRPSSAR